MEQNLKIQKKSAADLVCDKMKEFIHQGTWKAGEKIPTEMELSERFGVNRLTVRIALQRLHALGLLDIRVGDGTYVKSFDMNHQIFKLADFYINKDTLENVMEYRMVLELGCVKLILERRTDEELEHFRQLCEQFQQELAQYYSETDPDNTNEFWQKTIDTTEALHVTLIGMAHNDLMSYALSLAKEPMRRHMLYNASNRIQNIDDDFTNIWGKRWMQLYETLCLRDEKQCCQILKDIIGV